MVIIRGPSRGLSLSRFCTVGAVTRRPSPTQHVRLCVFLCNVNQAQLLMGGDYNAAMRMAGEEVPVDPPEGSSSDLSCLVSR